MADFWVENWKNKPNYGKIFPHHFSLKNRNPKEDWKKKVELGASLGDGRIFGENQAKDCRNFETHFEGKSRL